jgi:hypothetical protein
VASPILCDTSCTAGDAAGAPVSRLHDQQVMTPRISPPQALQHVTEDNALLVCAYEPDEKFQANYLSGAMSLHQLQAIEARLDRDREIIFYCA